MRRLLALIFILCSSAALFAAAKHSFTFEDMMKLKRVGEPEVSPDGKWVIFSVVDVDLAANTKTPHIWIVPLVPAKNKEKMGCPMSRRICETWAATNEKSSPIRMPTAPAGHPTASALHSSQPKKAARKSGSRTSIRIPVL